MKTNSVKTVLTTCLFVALALVGSEPAEGRPYSGSRPASRVYVSGHCHCGLRLYTERYFIGYDHNRRPRWGYRQVNRHYHQPIRPIHRHPIQPRPYPFHTPGNRGGVTIHGVIR